MEDIIEFRRKTSASGRWIGRKNPHIKIEMPRGTFVIFKKVANLLGAVDGDAIMFSFSRKDNCAYIYKEDPEEDSYYLCNSGREYYRFTSKSLMQYFVDFFDIKKEKTVYLDVLPFANDKGMFKIILSC